MAIKLSKGQTIDLQKELHDLDQITVGLGWKMMERPPKAPVASVAAGGRNEFDLDAIAFLLDDRGVVVNRGDGKLVGGDIVFFNSPNHPSGTVFHSGDNRVGGTGDQDDEQIVVKLNSVPPNYHRILFLVSIYKGTTLGQHFGQIESAYIRAVDGRNREMARYSIDSGSNYQNMCTLVFGEVERRAGGWKFHAIGDAHPYDSFVNLLLEHLPK